MLRRDFLRRAACGATAGLGLGYVRITPAEVFGADVPFPPDKPMPAYTLPDALITQKGEKIVKDADWVTKRRPELLELFQKYVYGRVPKTPYDQVIHVDTYAPDAMGGKAVGKELTIRISRGDAKLVITATVFVPKGATKPVPAFLLICNRPVENIDPTRSDKSEFWPAEEIVARGYAAVTFHNADLDPDKDDGFRDGIHALLDPPRKQDEERPGDAWGTIAAWAWGASRVLDALEILPEIDANRVAVIGHSRGGKTALWAGATDQRFALVISNDSGCTGASLSRRKFEGKEQVARINKSFPHWFCKNYAIYGDKEEMLPVDQHQLLALIAPRGLAVASASDDLWADPRGEFQATALTTPVYRLFGRKGLGPDGVAMPDVGGVIHGDGVHYHLREGKHDLNLRDWNAYLDFADRLWPRK